MLLFEFVRELFRFNVQTPAFDALFQLPPDIGQHMLRRLPKAVSLNPAAYHSAQLINQPAYCQKAVLCR